MQNPFAPLASIYQTQLEASRHFADAFFSNTEKIEHVMLDATRRAFTEQLEFAQSMAAVRDPQDAASVQSAFISQRPQRAMEYQRDIMQIFADMQNALGQSMRASIAQLGQSFVRDSEAAQALQPGDAAFNPVNDMFSMWESALREATALAGRNMAHARDNFESAVPAANAVYRRATAAAEEAAHETAHAPGKKAGAGGKRNHRH